MDDASGCPAPLVVLCDPHLRFLIEPPEGWAQGLIALPGVRLLLLDPNAPGPIRPTLNILVHDLGDMTSDDYLALSRLQLKGMGDNARLERDQPIGSQHGAHLFEFVARFSQAPIRCLQLLLFQGGKAFVATASAAPAEFEAYRSRFEAALSSFTIVTSG